MKRDTGRCRVLEESVSTGVGLELISAPHYTKAGRYTIVVKVIDMFGNDTMTLVPVNVG